MEPKTASPTFNLMLRELERLQRIDRHIENEIDEIKEQRNEKRDS